VLPNKFDDPSEVFAADGVPPKRPPPVDELDELPPKKPPPPPEVDEDDELPKLKPPEVASLLPPKLKAIFVNLRAAEHLMPRC